LRERQGFYDYRDVDVEAYKLQRLSYFVRKLELSGLTPPFDGALGSQQCLRPDLEK
jgi:3-hydroxybutyryl-CoA dehydrogenase